MTREDKAVTSKEEMQYYLANGKEFSQMQAPLFADMWRLFSKVFDTFESRTCNSCKLWVKHPTNEALKMCKTTSCITSETFYCKGWEQR